MCFSVQLDNSIEFDESIQVDDSLQFEPIGSPHIIVCSRAHYPIYALRIHRSSDSFFATELIRIVDLN